MNYTPRLEDLVLGFRLRDGAAGSADPAFRYTSGDTALLSLALRRALGAETLTAYAQRRLCVLALLLLGLHDGDRVWKSFDWDALDRLHEHGHISNPLGSAKSVVLTPHGKAKAQALLQAMFGKQG